MRRDRRCDGVIGVVRLSATGKPVLPKLAKLVITKGQMWRSPKVIGTAGGLYNKWIQLFYIFFLSVHWVDILGLYIAPTEKRYWSKSLAYIFVL